MKLRVVSCIGLVASTFFAFPVCAKQLSLDEQVHTLVNPVKPGITSSVSRFQETYPMSLKMLRLSSTTKPEKFMEVIQKRLTVYGENNSPRDPRSEALAVLGEPQNSKLPDLALRERLSLVSICMQSFRAVDPKHLHSDASDNPVFLLLSAKENSESKQ